MDIERIDLQRGSARGVQARFVASTWIDTNPQSSPDDQQVAFTSSRSGHNEVWVADKNGGNLLRLTFHGETGEVGSPHGPRTADPSRSISAGKATPSPSGGSRSRAETKRSSSSPFAPRGATGT